MTGGIRGRQRAGVIILTRVFGILDLAVGWDVAAAGRGETAPAYGGAGRRPAQNGCGGTTNPVRAAATQ